MTEDRHSESGLNRYLCFINKRGDVVQIINRKCTLKRHNILYRQKYQPFIPIYKYNLLKIQYLKLRDSYTKLRHKFKSLHSKRSDIVDKDRNVAYLSTPNNKNEHKKIVKNVIAKDITKLGNTSEAACYVKTRCVPKDHSSPERQVHDELKNCVKEMRYRCNICDSCFARKDTLQSHEVIHTGERNFTCSYPNCNRAYTRPSGLRAHRATHESPKFSCDTCPKQFNQKQSLILHEKAIHQNIKVYRKRIRKLENRKNPITCYECGKLYYNSSSLNTHIQAVHFKLKRFQCDLCQKSFARKGTLEDHIKVHTKAKPWTCEHCGLCFSRRGSLRQHKINKHTKNRPMYSCHLCGKKFLQKPSVKYHLDHNICL